MTSAADTLFNKPHSRALMFWAALAMLNLVAGIAISLSPQRLTDLESIMRWGREWLEGVNVYRVPDSYVDYPPNAIVLLSPLGLLPMRVAAPGWAMVNLALACAAPYFAARFFRPHDPFRVIALPIAMFLCWGGVRTLTQFTVASLAASMAALALADRHRWTAAVLLGVALIKPHVSLPVLLWGVFARRWHLVLASLAVAFLLLAAFFSRASDTPMSTLAGYAGAIMVYHSGDAVLTGLSELRPLIWRLLPDKSNADVIAGSIAMGLLSAICVYGFREGTARRPLYAAPALVACWCLLTFRHLTYGFVVLLPVLMLLALSDAERSPLRKALFWTLQIGMMFDIPGLSRRIGLGDTALYANVLVHADRVLILSLLVGLVVLAWRDRPEPSLS